MRIWPAMTFAKKGRVFLGGGKLVFSLLRSVRVIHFAFLLFFCVWGGALTSSLSALFVFLSLVRMGCASRPIALSIFFFLLSLVP